MPPIAIESLGYLAAALTTLAFVPQVVKAWRTKSVDDLSLGMLVLFATGILLWLAYGLALRAAPIVSANAATFVLTATLIRLKIRHRRDASSGGAGRGTVSERP